MVLSDDWWWVVVVIVKVEAKATVAILDWDDISRGEGSTSGGGDDNNGSGG